MNTNHDGEPVLFLVNGQSAGLHARVFLKSWHNYTFYESLNKTSTPEAALAVMRRQGIGFVIVPTGARMGELPQDHLGRLVSLYTETEHSVNGYAVARLLPVLN